MAGGRQRGCRRSPTPTGPPSATSRSSPGTPTTSCWPPTPATRWTTCWPTPTWPAASRGGERQRPPDPRRRRGLGQPGARRHPGVRCGSPAPCTPTCGPDADSLADHRRVLPDLLRLRLQRGRRWDRCSLTAQSSNCSAQPGRPCWPPWPCCQPVHRPATRSRPAGLLAGDEMQLAGVLGAAGQPDRRSASSAALRWARRGLSTRRSSATRWPRPM